MRRRDTIIGLTALAAVWLAATPAPLIAQSRMPVIGYLNGLAAEDRPILAEAFRKGLASTGYHDGQNVKIEYKYAGSRAEQLPGLVAELVKQNVTVIAATGGNAPALAAKAASNAIPIVFTSGLDPIEAGLVSSFSRPEANVTGITWFGAELAPKHLQLARELVPASQRIAVIIDRNSPESRVYEKSLHAATESGKLQLEILPASSPAEIENAFKQLDTMHPDVLLVGVSPFLTSRAHQITLLARQHRFPTVYSNREFVEAGGLASYGAQITDAYRRAGVYAGKLISGKKPSDLPVDRDTKLELVLSLNAFKGLGLAIPPSLQVMVDEALD